MLTTSQALLKRKSVRAFLDKLVDRELVEQILEHAKYAPSGTNTQPWQVVVVSGNTKQKLDNALIQAFRDGKAKSMDYKYYPEELTLDMKKRRLACGLQMFRTLEIKREDTEKRLAQWELNYSAFGAPIAIYVFMPKIVEKGSFLDCGMFIQSIVLMATSLGLSTCIQAALAEHADIVRDNLSMSDDMLLVCGIALGYEYTSALVNSYKTPREELANFVKFLD